MHQMGIKHQTKSETLRSIDTQVLQKCLTTTTKTISQSKNNFGYSFLILYNIER